MRRLTRLLPFLLLIAALPAMGQHRRVVTFHLQRPPWTTRGFAINNLREVAGTVGSEIPDQKGFIWANGRFRQVFQYKILPRGHTFMTQVYGINDRGDTVGNFATDGTIPGVGGPFVRDRLGHGMLLPLVNGIDIASPFAINDAGTIVGSSASKGFILVGGHYTLLAYPGAGTTTATGINRWGTVVGWYSASFEAPKFGYIYSNGRFQTTFQCVDGGVARTTDVRAINDWGEIAGNCGTRMFVRDRFGTITFIDLKNAVQPILTGINNHGDLTGYFRPSPGGIDTFVVYNALRRH